MTQTNSKQQPQTIKERCEHEQFLLGRKWLPKEGCWGQVKQLARIYPSEQTQNTIWGRYTAEPFRNHTRSYYSLPTVHNPANRVFLCMLTAQLMSGNGNWYISLYNSTQMHSLVTENVPVLVRVESKLEDPIHHTALDGQLGILQLLLTGVLPYDILSHCTIQKLQKVLHLSSFIVSGSKFLEVSKENSRL